MQDQLESETILSTNLVQFQINVLSEEIYLTYFENKMNHMRPVVAKLKEILDDMDRAVTMHNDAKSVCIVFILLLLLR